MDIIEAMGARHSVRSYTDKALEPEAEAALRAETDVCNLEGGLNIQIVTGEPEAFGTAMAHYGSFKNVKNYIALIGKRCPELDERAGYYGERIVLTAQMLGLNTCWVALNYSKSKSKRHCVIKPDEKLVCTISLGYGETQGSAHKSKPMGSFYKSEGEAPEWFMRGIEAAMLAPTAVNQQKFLFTYENGSVSAKATGGFYSKIDLGIVKYHFEAGSGRPGLLRP